MNYISYFKKILVGLIFAVCIVLVLQINSYNKTALANHDSDFVHLRTGSGYCNVTNLTNATPPVLTCDSDPNWSDGQGIMVTNLLVSGPLFSPANGQRYVDRLTATTYALYEEASLTTPTPAPGVWFAGTGKRWAGSTQAYELADGITSIPPETLKAFRCDVTSGCLTNIVVTGGTAVATIPAGHGFAVGKGIGVWGSGTANLNTETATVSAVTGTTVSWSTSASNGTYTDAQVSERAHNNNPVWLLLKSACSTFDNTILNTERTAELNQACLFKYYVDRSDTSARDKAEWAIDHVEDVVMGATYCRESNQYCNGRGDVDYAREFVTTTAVIYDVLDHLGELSAGQKTTYLDKVLTDRRSDPGCLNPDYTTLTGTISVSGTTDLVGVGTQFTTETTVGGVLWFTEGGPSNEEYYVYRIVAINSDTSITLNKAGTYSGTGYHSRPWQTGDCGILFITFHHPISGLGDPTIYPTTGGGWQEGYYFTHNLLSTAVFGYTFVGAILAKDDSRAKSLFEQIWSIGWDNPISANISMNAGGSSMGSAYSWGRANYLDRLSSFMKSAVPSYPSYTGIWNASMIRLAPWAYNHGDYNYDGAFFTYFGETSLAVSPYNAAGVLQTLETQSLSTDERRAFQSMISALCGGSVGQYCFSWGGQRGVANAFRGYNPQLDDLDLRTLPKAIYRGTASPELCTGAASCFTGRTFQYAISRSGWTGPTGSSTDVILHVGSGTTENDHHSDNSGAFWVQAGINSPVNGEPCLIGSDFSTCSGSYSEGGISYLSMSAHNRKSTVSTATTSRYGIHDDYFHIAVDTKGAFTSAPTRADRQFVHFTKGVEDDFIVVRTHAEASSGTINYWTHYTQNNQWGTDGSTNCAGAACSVGTVNSNIHSTSSTKRITSTTVYPDDSKRGRRYISGTNGSYTGGNGYTFRLGVCATSDDATCNSSATKLLGIDVHLVGATASSTTLTATALSSNGWDGVQAVSANSAIVAMFVSTSTKDSMPTITTTHSGTGRYVVTGLNTGTYYVIKNGLTIESDLVVSSGDQSLYFESTSGSISIEQSPAAVDSIAPTLSSIASSVTSSSAIITWTTNESADSNVDSGLTSSYGTASTSSTLGTSHSITLPGLSPSTTYHYRVYSRDATGNSATSSDTTFTTSATPDTTAPTISSVNSGSVTTSGATITWSTDESADSYVDYGLTSGYGSTVNSGSLTTSHSLNISSLSSNTTYHYRVYSRDATGNSATSSDTTFTTSAESSGGGGGGGGGGGSNNSSGSSSGSSSNNSSVTVAAVPSQVPQVVNSSSFGGGKIKNNLWRGVKGAEVLTLQELLVEKGYLKADDKTGYYGYNTEAAVKKFQKANGIASSGNAISTGYGVVGPTTKKLLNDYLAKNYSNVAENVVSMEPKVGLRQIKNNLWRGVKGAEVLTLQELLVEKGYLKADDKTGYYGYNTEAAVKKFQKANGIASSGNAISTGYGVVGPTTKKLINNLIK